MVTGGHHQRKNVIPTKKLSILWINDVKNHRKSQNCDFSKKLPLLRMSSEKMFVPKCSEINSGRSRDVSSGYPK